MEQTINQLDRYLILLADPTLSDSSRQELGQVAKDAVARLRVQYHRAEQAGTVWRGRVEALADALQDVAPGELGRLDLLGRINRLKAQRDAAEERCRQLAAAGQVLSVAVDQRVGAPLGPYEIARNAIGGEIANLPNHESQPPDGRHVSCHAPDHINCPCSWDPPAECRYPTPVMVEPATIVSDFAAMNPIAALAQKAGAKNGREAAAFKAGHEAASKDAPMREARCYDGGKRHGYTTGVESMRTECWHVVQTTLREHGIHITDMLWDGLKKAIEGATP